MTTRRLHLEALCAAMLSVFWLISGATRAAEGPGQVAEAPKRAVIGMQLEPPVLDPTVNPAAAIAEALYANLYEGLVKFAPDGSVLPALAESWEMSGDGLTYVFHLRAGVHFHNGAHFDAATAKFSLERALEPGSVNPQRSRLSAIRSVSVIDGRTLSLAGPTESVFRSPQHAHTKELLAATPRMGTRGAATLRPQDGAGPSRLR